MCLAHWLDAERGGQLAEKQPRSSPCRAARHGVEQRVQRCSGGAVMIRRGSQPASDAAPAIALCFGHVGVGWSATWHMAYGAP
eukprot:810224-Prymnesium_polylepis.1